uniref:PPPDE domain-containing protein n=1 Tax=Odontella aurita TaxID=265563 RepID=A0A7S4K8M2_9STRA
MSKLARPLFVLRDGLLVDSTRRLKVQKDEGGKEEERFVVEVDTDHEELEDLDVECIPEDSAGRDAGKSAGWKCPGLSADGKTCTSPGTDPRCSQSLYGDGEASPSPKLEGKTRKLAGPDEDGGLVYHALLLPDDYDEDPSKILVLSPRDYDASAGGPKARRKSPFPLKSAEFFSSLTLIGRPEAKTEEEAGYDELWDTSGRTSSDHGASSGTSAKSDNTEGARWVFRGVLNGWPGLVVMELRSIEIQERSKISGRTTGWKQLWAVDNEGSYGVDPSKCVLGKKSRGMKGDKRRIRAELRAPEWTARGWSAESPGFLFWVTGPSVSEPTAPPVVTYGTDIQSIFKCPEEEDPQCDRVTMICHRYATGGKSETAKDKLTYHSLALLEWDHAQYCTVVEIGWLNGIGGYKGKANWYDDKDDPSGSALYGALPPEMVLPWKSTMSEIRCYDVPFRNLDHFKTHINKYLGKTSRFLDPRYTFSHEVRLTYRSRRNIATYLLNYIRRDRTYSEMKRNCQTFTADLCAFLAGKKDVQPFHPVNQLQYVNQKHKFLYESGKYVTKKGKK